MMNFINPPETSPQHVTHGTFYSKLIGQDVGYNIYLPPDYVTSGRRYMVTYHLHGYTGHESTEIWPMEKVYKSRDAIIIFANATSSDNGYLDKELPIESIIITELIPYIDGHYRTLTDRSNRALSGFSMGGAAAFYYAVKYPGLFGSVTSYAGTFHHFLHQDYWSIWGDQVKAAELYEKMKDDTKFFKEDSILYMVGQKADEIRGQLDITLHVGDADMLFCENEIMHLYLASLSIPHEYKIFTGAEHELEKIL